MNYLQGSYSLCILFRTLCYTRSGHVLCDVFDEKNFFTGFHLL